MCRFLPLAVITLLVAASPVLGQWTNRYPKLAGYSHHVYLEGYELPTLAVGPTGAVPSPDGRMVALSARGWIWLLDPATGVARRLTRGPHMDFRPAWSPDGTYLAFVRDDTRDTRIVIVRSDDGEEVRTVDTPAIELDPVFTPEGDALLYTSAASGAFDLWRVDLEGGAAPIQVTAEAGLELRAQPGPGGALVYLAKGRAGRDLVLYRPGPDAAPRTLLTGAIASLARPALGPDGRTVAVSWPREDGWELRLLDIDAPDRPVVLTADHRPLTPAWSPDGRWIYFSEADAHERVHLRRIPAAGGRTEAVPIRAWEWGEPTGRLRIRTSIAGQSSVSAARLAILDGQGHPVLPDDGVPRFDGQSGRVYVYSPGVVEVTVPAGPVTVSAVAGLATPEETTTVDVSAGAITHADVTLRPVLDLTAAGWVSADHHFHLNYGGPYRLAPEDLLPLMEAERLDLATPLVANLHNRFEGRELWGWEPPPGAPLIRFGQEVRSHFLGHMGLMGTRDLHWPWVWGPGYQVYGRDDRTNADVLEFAHDQGGQAFYVHPVGVSDPFSEDGRARVPVELVVDAVHGDVDGLELVCLWSSAVGTTRLWYRFLNLGIPVAPSAGTDVMTNFYRTMAVGTARVYARVEGAPNWPAYLNAWREGRSFVTNGPLLEFEVEGRGPGDVVDAGPRSWTATVASAVPVERIEVVVNGEVVWEDDGLDAPGVRTLSGSVELPSGGWVALRALGGDVRWPAMDVLPFAHTGPTWIESVGSSDPAARSRAAQELDLLLDAAEARLEAGYAGEEIPRLRARFESARARLADLR